MRVVNGMSVPTPIDSIPAQPKSDMSIDQLKDYIQRLQNIINRGPSSIFNQASVDGPADAGIAAGRIKLYQDALSEREQSSIGAGSLDNKDLNTPVDDIGYVNNNVITNLTPSVSESNSISSSVPWKKYVLYGGAGLLVIVGIVLLIKRKD